MVKATHAMQTFYNQHKFGYIIDPEDVLKTKRDESSASCENTSPADRLLDKFMASLPPFVQREMQAGMKLSLERL